MVTNERRNARKREQYAENPEPFKARNERYRAKHRDRLAEKQREYNQRPEVKERQRAWREANRELCNERARQAREQVATVIRAARDKPCVDCAIKLPAEIMEFDHVHGEKSFTISHWEKQCRSSGTGKTRLQLVEEEIAKCDIRCPNCHRLRHYNEGSGNFASQYPLCNE